MRRRRLLIAAIVVVLAAFSIYWGLLDRVLVMFIVQPGGRDVVVTVDDRVLAPSTVSSDSNLYSFSLRHGKYRIIVRKPGFRMQTRAVNVEWGDGDEYPVFPPLQRVGAGRSGP